MIKNIDGLRTVLAEEIDNLRSGNTTAANVNAVTNASGKILSSIKLEMEFCKLTGRTPQSLFLSDGKKQRT